MQNYEISYQIKEFFSSECNDTLQKSVNIFMKVKIW